MTEREFRRKRRVVDQMLTGHSLLRERLEHRSLALSLFILALSIVATSVAFLSGEAPISMFGIHARAQIWIGSLTLIIFFLALVDIRVDWRQRAGMHGDAARRLASLKSLYRTATARDGLMAATGADLAVEYDRVMEQLPPIPEKAFLWVKSKHGRKVQISKLLDSHPGAPVWCLNLLALYKGIRGNGPIDDAESE